MSNRSRQELAAETVAIVERGSYLAPSGQRVDLRDAIERSRRSTAHVEPGTSLPAFTPAPGPLRVEVTDETTGAAARRLVEREGEAHVLALNFASARNPGGGFLRGAKAQEEDLAIASALHASLATQPQFYAVHRASASMLYSDRMIYSPAVPFFRDEDGTLLERPFQVSILTSPAPNRGEMARRDPDESHLVGPTLRARARRILEVAAAHGHRCLVLGAWGCGVFRNDPAEVAEAFAVVTGAPLAGAFERVVFAVYDRGVGQPNLRAFRARFAPT